MILLGFVSWKFLAGDGVDRSVVYSIYYGNDVPFHFKGPDGSPTGLAVDLVRESARAKNIRLNWVDERAGGAPPHPLRVLISIRTNLFKDLHLTEPYLQGRSSFIVPNNSPVRTVTDLQNKRISYPNYAIHRANLARVLTNYVPTPAPSSLEAMQTLMAGNADAAFMSDYAVVPACLNVPSAFGLRILPSQAPVSRMALAAPHEYARLAEVLRDGIRDMAVDGRLERIVDQWGFFPNLITDRREELVKAKRKVRALQVTAGFLLAMVGVSAWLINRLRIETSHARAAERTQRQAELALKASEQKSRAIVESSPVPMAVNDDQQRITFVNHAFVKTYGYTLEEIPTLIDWWPKAYPDPTYREWVIDTWRAERDRSRQTGTEFQPLEVRIRAKDGTDRVALATASLLQGLTRSEYLVVLVDITDRKRQETERQKLEAQLRHAQKMEAIGVLAGGIAHDFNNILVAIIGNASLAGLTLEADHRANRFLQEIHKASARATELVRQILAFSRKENREQMVMNLRLVVEEATRLLRSTLPASVEVNAHFDGAPLAWVDPSEIHQIMINLGTNAWHALGGSVGEIRVAVASVAVDADRASANPDLRVGQYALVTVSDTGHGMTPEIMEHIFEPFFTTKEVGKGTGLGLSVVHGIVKSHHGAILVRSEVGKGTTFELYFPAAPEQPIAETEPAPMRPAIQGQNQRILLVEDEESVIKVTSMLLERRGFRVTAITRPEAAILAFETAPDQFDLVITDFNMPVLSGVELTRKIQKIRPGMPVILVSGFMTDQVRQEAAAAGVTHLANKPLSSDELLQIIHRIFAPANRP